MIVIDASAMVEALVGRDVDHALIAALTGKMHAPHLLDTEVLSALRGLVLGSRLAISAAEEARRTYVDFTIDRHETRPLADRIWQLRHQYTTYDASYIALAEALDAPLLTCDRKLDRGGHQADIRVFSNN